MRTFIAIELSDGVRRELARLQDELRASGADVKWAKPENIHLTLKFLGNVDEDKIGGIKTVLDEIASTLLTFEISLFKTGAFPSLNSPRVIWVGIDKGCAETEKCASFIEERLEKIGFPKEERPFSAHLTLGRTRSPKNKASLTEKLSTLSVEPASCPVKGITLFQSTLTPKGPIYTLLHVANFKG